MLATFVAIMYTASDIVTTSSGTVASNGMAFGNGIVTPTYALMTTAGSSMIALPGIDTAGLRAGKTISNIGASMPVTLRNYSIAMAGGTAFAFDNATSNIRPATFTGRTAASTTAGITLRVCLPSNSASMAPNARASGVRLTSSTRRAIAFGISCVTAKGTASNGIGTMAGFRVGCCW